MKGIKFKVGNRTKPKFVAVIVENAVGWGLDLGLEAIVKPKGMLGHLGIAVVSSGAGTLAGEAVKRIMERKTDKQEWYYDADGDYIIVEMEM